MAKYGSRFSTVDTVIAAGFALVWVGASLTAILLGLRRGAWVVLIAGPLGLWYGVLWVRAAQKGRRLDWREAICPWRRR